MPTLPAKTVEYHAPTTCGLLDGDRFEVVGIIPALSHIDRNGRLWTCDTYFLRSQDDGAEYIAPVSMFHEVAPR